MSDHITWKLSSSDCGVSGGGKTDLSQADSPRQWVAAIYFITMTITTVGVVHHASSARAVVHACSILCSRLNACARHRVGGHACLPGSLMGSMEEEQQLCIWRAMYSAVP